MLRSVTIYFASYLASLQHRGLEPTRSISSSNCLPAIPRLVTRVMVNLGELHPKWNCFITKIGNIGQQGLYNLNGWDNPWIFGEFDFLTPPSNSPKGSLAWGNLPNWSENSCEGGPLVDPEIRHLSWQLTKMASRCSNWQELLLLGK